MSAAMDAKEIALRTVAAAGLSLFVVRAYAYYAATGELPVLLLLVAETITVLLVIFARAPQVRATDPLSLVLTFCATYYFLLIALQPGAELAPKWMGVTLQVAGIALQLTAKMFLGRSFGLLPANRGVVTTGPYRLVRHPIYLGYFIAHMGYLLYAFTPANVAVFTALYGLQAARILREERVLCRDERYLRYATAVRWRLLPGVF